MHPGFSSFFANLNLFFGSATLIVYGAMFFCFYIKKSKIKEGTFEFTNFMKQQSSVMPTIKLLFAFYLMSCILLEIMINICMNIDSTSPQVLLAMVVGGILKSLSSLADFLALVLRSSKFCECFWSLIKCKPNTSVVGIAGQTDEQ